MASIIFYGAGRNAQGKMNTWKEQGLVPVSFSDADSTKHYKSFMGIPVLPLTEIFQQYPDYVLYCTQAPENLYDVRNFLLGIGIPESKIKFCEQLGDCPTMKKAGGGVLQSLRWLYPQIYRIYQAMQDDLSRKWFLGRMAYSCSSSLTEIYRTMLCRDHLEWVAGKQTYGMQRYGLHALWDLLKENYPVQKHKIWLLAFDEEWNEYDWVVERFLEAMPGLGITISGCCAAGAKTVPETCKGLPCITEKDFLSRIDESTGIIVGFPGWCLQMAEVVKRYEDYKDILFPIADTAHPQYVEEDIFSLAEDEIYVDVGVFDLQNSIDFSKWAKKGYEKIYAFEPDPGCYRRALERIKTMDDEFQSKIELIPKGLSSHGGVLKFPAEYRGSGVYRDSSEIMVEVVSLDSYLDGRPVTLVKMDVEGAEMDVLLGMRETILNHKPKLEICIYHKHEDLFDITSYLLDLIPEYRFYLRHYNSNETETVLFCMI